MTWLDIATITIIGLNGIVAFQRGFIKTLFSFVSLIVTVIITKYIYPYFSGFLMKTTGVFDGIKNSVMKLFDLDNIGQEIISPQQQINYINDLPLPKQLKSMLIANNNNEIYDIFNIDHIGEYVGSIIASLAINIISFLVVFIIVTIILRIVINILDLVSKLPVLNQINKMGGLILGLLMGVTIVWILCLLISLLSTNASFTNLILMMQKSPITRFLYENNILLDIVTNISKTII